jgi:hypothetical protein
MILPDGTAECDRCGVALDGYGVLNGLIADAGDQQLIFCYVNFCRDTAVFGMINYVDPDLCTNTGQPILRATSDAILAVDLDPANPEEVRRLAFCRELGCADQLLNQIESE